MVQEKFHHTPFLRWRQSFVWLHLLRVPGIATRLQILFTGFVVSFLLMVLNVLLTGTNPAQEITTLRTLINNPLPTLQQSVNANITIYELASQATTLTFDTNLILPGVTLMVHVIFGLIICRMACVEFTVGKGVCLERSALFAVKKIPATLVAFLFPVFIIGILSGFAALILLLEKIPVIGIWVSGLGYGISILLIFASIILTIGLVIGWTLFLAVLACENSDGFDAWSRTFDYIRSRLIPILTAFFITMAMGLFLLGCAGELTQLTFAAIDSMQSTILGQPLEEIQKRCSSTFAQGESGFQMLWQTLWKTLLQGFLISFYWCTVTAIYILTRHSVDRTPVDEYQQG